MSDVPPPRAGAPLDRLVQSLLAWDSLPFVTLPGPRTRRRIEPDQIVLERAKGAVMLRYGVNSHVAFAMLSRWSRAAGVSLATLANELVQATLSHGVPPSLDGWPDERLTGSD